MKRFFLFWVLLLALSPRPRAATVTGTIIDLTGATEDEIVIFTPADAPRHTSQGSVWHRPLSVQSINGVYTATLVQGQYRITIEGQVLKTICVPAGTGTYSVHLGQVDCGTVGLYLGNTANQVIVSTNDTLPLPLSSKIQGGTNVVLTTTTNIDGSQYVSINSIAISGATFDTNTLTLTFTGPGGGGGGSAGIWGSITGDLTSQTDLQTALSGKEDQSANLDAWSLIATSTKQAASANLAAWSNVAPSTKQAASANLTNWSALLTSAKQDSSANLASWSALATSAKQDASANLGSWSLLAPSTKQAADTDLDPLAAGITGIVKGAGNGGGYSAATSGTDYAPATSGSSILSGNGSGGFSAVTVGSGLSFSGGNLTASATGSGNAVLTNAAASKAVVTDASTNLTTSATTTTELGYVSGVTSAIQTQLNAKQAADVDLNWLASGNTGVIKGLGNGNGYTNAVAGTDFVAPGPVSTSGLVIATNNVLVGETTGAGSAPDLIVIGNGLSLSGKTLSLITNLLQMNIGVAYITNAIASGSMVVTNGITNLTLTAGTMIKAGTDKALATATAGVDYQAPVTTNTYVNAFGYIAAYDGFFNKNTAGTKSTTDGVLMLLNWAETDFNRLSFGQPVSTNVSLKKSSSALQVRNGDDSADAPLSALYFQASDGFFGVSKGGFKSWQDGYVTLYNFAENAFTRLQFGGTNSSAPAIGVNGAGFSDILADGSAPTFRLGSTLVTAKTTNYTLIASDSRTLFTNAGATNTVNFTLPTWASGLNYTFSITDAQTLTVTAPGTDTIRIAGSVTAGGGNVTTNVIGNSISISAVKSGKWLSTAHEGVWAVN